MIRVLVVHEHCLIGQSIGAALAEIPGICIVGYATTIETTLTLLQEQACDVILISSRLPDNATFQLSRTVRNQGVPIKVLVTDLIDTKSLILTFLEEGAAGYIHEQEPLQSVVDKLHNLVCDEFPLPPTIAAGLISRLIVLKQSLDYYGAGLKKQEQCSSISLTEREQEVLKLLMLEFNTQRIATTLFIQPGTVKHHVHSIFRKLYVKNRKEAVLVAKRFIALVTL